jgi:hypothetical protein
VFACVEIILLAVPVRRGTAAIQLDERPAHRVGADHRVALARLTGGGER